MKTYQGTAPSCEQTSPGALHVLWTTYCATFYSCLAFFRFYCHHSSYGAIPRAICSALTSNLPREIRVFDQARLTSHSWKQWTVMFFVGTLRKKLYSSVATRFLGSAIAASTRSQYVTKQPQQCILTSSLWRHTRLMVVTVTAIISFFLVSKITSLLILSSWWRTLLRKHQVLSITVY